MVTTDRFCAEYDKEGGIRLSCGRGELIATANHTRNDVQGWADRAGGPEWKQKYEAALALLDGRRCPHLDEHHESVERVTTVGYEYDAGGLVRWHVAKKGLATGPVGVTSAPGRVSRWSAFRCPTTASLPPVLTPQNVPGPANKNTSKTVTPIPMIGKPQVRGQPTSQTHNRHHPHNPQQQTADQWRTRTH